LTEFSDYRRWHPLIERVEGDAPRPLPGSCSLDRQRPADYRRVLKRRELERHSVEDYRRWVETPRRVDSPLGAVSWRDGDHRRCYRDAGGDEVAQGTVPQGHASHRRGAEETPDGAAELQDRVGRAEEAVRRASRRLLERRPGASGPKSDFPAV